MYERWLTVLKWPAKVGAAVLLISLIAWGGLHYGHSTYMVLADRAELEYLEYRELLVNAVTTKRALAGTDPEIEYIQDAQERAAAEKHLAELRQQIDAVEHEGAPTEEDFKFFRNKASALATPILFAMAGAWLSGIWTAVFSLLLGASMLIRYIVVGPGKGATHHV